MKTTFLLFVFLISLINTSLVAQDYQPFKNTYAYQYSYIPSGEYANGGPNAIGIHCIKVDSARIVKGDSVFYFTNIAEPFDDNLWGTSMIKKANGDFLFSFKSEDTLLIKTNAAVDDQWFFKRHDDSYTITCKSIQEEIVLNNTKDLVKTFIVENSSGFIDSIKLSKKYGMISSFPFINHQTKGLFVPFPAKKLKLEFIYTIALGINRLNYLNYFTFDEGDMFIYTSQYHTKPSYTGNDVLKVLSKTISKTMDTITYNMINCQISGTTDGHYSTTKSYKTLKVSEYSILPADFYHIFLPDDFYPLLNLLNYPLNKDTLAREYCSYSVDTINASLYLRTPINPFEKMTALSFTKGLGLTGFSATQAMSYERYYSLKEHYTNINTDDNCDAVDLVLSVSDPLKESSSVLVSPNPFTEQCVIKGNQLPPGNYTVHIHSVMGTEVYKADVLVSSEDGSLTLSNLSALVPGLYTVSIEGAQKQFRCTVVKQ